MKLTQRRLVIGAIVVSESAWLFSVFGAFGVMFGHDGSPLSWMTIMTVILLPFVVAKFEPSVTTATELLVLTRILIGAAVVYVVVAVNIPSGAIIANLGWGIHLLNGGVLDANIFVYFGGVFIGIVLWLRGFRIVEVESPKDSLSFSFRLGMMALAVAMSFDIAKSSDIRTLPMMFVFFASGLGGLSVGHLLPETRKSAETRTWHKVIVGVISMILLAGAVFSFIQKDLMAGFTEVVLNSLSVLVTSVLWILLAPISYVITVFTNVLISFFDGEFETGSVGGDFRVGEGGTLAAEQQLQALGTIAEMKEEEGSIFFNFIHILGDIILIMVAIIILVLLALMIRRIFRWQPSNTPGTRESIIEDRNVLSDLGRLVTKLIPNSLMRSVRRKGLRIPDGPVGLVEVIRIYYDLLIMAEEKGSRRPSHKTPTEFRDNLERVFPQNLVGMSTSAFNRAFYGRRPASEEQIAQMRSSVKNIKNAMGIMRKKPQNFRDP